MVLQTMIDSMTEPEWRRSAGNFADYNIYQTWPYQKVRGQMDNQDISRIVIEDENGDIEMMGQVRIKHVKTLGLRIGYCQWGPLVRGRNGAFRCSAQALNMLYAAYVGKRVNVLRIVPNVRNDAAGQEFARLLEANGFRSVRSAEPYHTMFLSLNSTDQALRKKMHQSWRRKLKKAENHNIEIIQGTDDESITILKDLYLERMRSKRITGLDPQVFVPTQRMLSDTEKINVIVAYYDGEPVTAHATSNLGDTGILLLVASNEKGLVCQSAYLAWWKAISLSNRAGMKNYDVGGIDFKKNTTVSQFKAGMGGQEVSYIGTFDACSGVYAKATWGLAETMYRVLKK